MKAIYYHVTTGRVNYDILSIGLRVPYLITDKVLMACDTTCNIYLIEFFKSFKTLSKILILESLYEKKQYDEAYLNCIRSIKKNYYKQKEVKHPDKKLLILYNKLMHQVDILFKNYVSWILNCYQQYGLIELSKIDDDTTFDFLIIEKDNAVHRKRRMPSLKTTEFAKSLLPSKEVGGIIITVSKDFLSPEFLNNRKIYEYRDKEAMNEGEIYLHKSLILPLPIILNADELKSVKNHLSNDTIVLNERIEKWYNCFIENESTESRINFFEKEVIPCMQEIQKSIDNIELLNYVRKTNIKGPSDITVWIGEAPLTTIWEFYKYVGQLEEEEYGNLETAVEINPLLKNRVVIMVLDAEGDYPEATDKIIEFEEPAIIAGRKYISINE